MSTIVGSWPQTLPEGREALERAMRLTEDFASWLPERYRSMTVTALREELRKLDEAAP